MRVALAVTGTRSGQPYRWVLRPVRYPAACLVVGDERVLDASVLVFRVQRGDDMGDDSAVGVVFVAPFALGVVLDGWLRLKAPDVSAAIVGDLVGVGRADLLLSAALVLLLLATVGLLYRPLVLSSFDRLAAQALALPMGVLDTVMLVAVAATAVVSVKSVGVILTVALLVTPQVPHRFEALEEPLPSVGPLQATAVP